MNALVCEASPITVCLAGFLYQTVTEVHTQYLSGKTTVTMEKTTMARLGRFPVLFRLLVKPGMNSTELDKAGYSSKEDYYMGRSKYSGDKFGWGGHTLEGVGKGEVEGKKGGESSILLITFSQRYFLQSGFLASPVRPAEICPSVFQGWILHRA